MISDARRARGALLGEKRLSMPRRSIVGTSFDFEFWEVLQFSQLRFQFSLGLADIDNLSLSSVYCVSVRKFQISSPLDTHAM